MGSTRSQSRHTQDQNTHEGDVATLQHRAQDLDWKDLKRFMDTAEAGSLRAAAVKTGCAINTIRNSIARIEDRLGCPVANRSHTGLKLTDEGRELLRVARQMRVMSKTTGRRRAGDVMEMAGELRIAVTEGLGTFWLMPRLVNFQNANPQLRLHLTCSMQRVDLRERDTDIAVQLHPPTEPEMIFGRLGTLHLMPFASEAYLRQFGIPQSVDDWPNHRLVWQDADQVASEILPLFIGTSDPGKLIGVTTNTSSAHFSAVAQGSGIGFLPTYTRAITKKVRPLDIGVHLKREIFYVYHPDARRSRPIKQALAWLRTSFSPKDYPWFADQFTHPTDLEKRLSDAVVVNLFEGFIDASDEIL